MDKKTDVLTEATKATEAREKAGQAPNDAVLRALLYKKSGRQGLKEISDPTIREALERASGELEGRLDRRHSAADEIIGRTLEVYVRDLPELAAELDGKTDFEMQAQLVTESSDWYFAMSDVEYLEILYRQGRFTKETANRYEQLRRAIAEHQPLIERLGFYVPEIPLTD